MSVQTTNVYDFDHTVYDGDSSFDFILFCMIRNPRCWTYAPAQAIALVQFIFGLSTREKVKETAFAFLPKIHNLDSQLERFWKKHEKRIKPWYLAQKNSSDVIISASPEFLLLPIVNQLGITTLIGTRMDPHTGKLTGKNCRAEEKVKRLYAYDGAIKINNCYSDSLSDSFLFAISASPYVVRKNKIIPLDDYQPSPLSKFKNPKFIRFIFVGGINAFFGIFLAYGISFFVTNELKAWVLGYLLSLTISYPLNAIITFRQIEFSWKQFASFCISYIPNFLIQYICVYVLVEQFHLYRLATYILAVAIATPITFLLLSGRTFKRNDTK